MQKLVVVSNRLPISFQIDGDKVSVQPSSGGLVTALVPILRRSGGLWIGWDGGAEIPEEVRAEELSNFSLQSGFQFTPVVLDKKDVDGFYNGFSNEIIWPLFHDLTTRCNFEPSYWEAYTKVNGTFAETVNRVTDPTDFVWVQDFHLLGLAAALRALGSTQRIGFFLHIPFPPPDIFRKLPWRDEILTSLLKYSHVGLQSARDFRNFCDCFALRPDTTVTAKGKTSAVIRSNTGEECTVGVYPISIDFNEFNELGLLEDVKARAEGIRSEMNVEHIALSVDRLDYTKGITYRIKAFAKALEMAPEFRRKVALIQLVVPSRESVPEYQALRAEIEQLVTQVNGSLGETGWIPVHHFFRSISREELVALYSAANVAFVTPLKDGMNLVCKEYLAAHHDEKGVLILSEFAGAAEELGKQALTVNPVDIEGMAKAFIQALQMPEEERIKRGRELREYLKTADVFSWATSFLLAAGWKGELPSTNQSGTRIWERLRRLISKFDV